MDIVIESSNIEIATFVDRGLEPLVEDGLSKVARWHLGKLICKEHLLLKFTNNILEKG